MKFFIVTCVKDYQPEVLNIFKQANIDAFSSTELVGFKDNKPLNLMADWFASGEEKFDSLMLFSFTSAEIASRAMELIKQYNMESETSFPLRAFIVPVEAASY